MPSPNSLANRLRRFETISTRVIHIRVDVATDLYELHPSAGLDQNGGAPQIAVFFGNRNRLELHQKIRIASLRVEVPTQNGTKSREPPHPVLPAKASDVFEIAFEEAIDGAFEGRIALDGRFAQHVSLRKQYPLPNPQHPKLEWPTMFPYDPELLAAVQTTPQTIAEVASIMQAIDSHCVNGDGLKWFNLLYMQVTQAVEARVNVNGFLNPGWMATLDVGFAGFYFRAIQSSLGGQPITRLLAGARYTAQPNRACMYPVCTGRHECAHQPRSASGRTCPVPRRAD
jgi:Family of unknown function (DUF5995)